jgi:hypothetical protein
MAERGGRNGVLGIFFNLTKTQCSIQTGRLEEISGPTRAPKYLRTGILRAHKFLDRESKLNSSKLDTTLIPFHSVSFTFIPLLFQIISQCHRIEHLKTE